MQPTQATTVLLVDKRPLMRSGIALVLGSYPDLHVVGQAGSGEDAIRLAAQHLPNVLVADTELAGGLRVREFVRGVRSVSHATRFLILSNSLEPHLVQEILREGVTGYLLRTATEDEFIQAIRAIHHGLPALSAEVTRVLIEQTSSPTRLMRQLTGREKQVLHLMARGWNNQQIAAELNISLSTVQFHVGNIFEKLQVRNRTEAATFALRHRLAGDQPSSPDSAQA